MILKLIIGIVATYLGFYGHSQFSPVLFVEGMILINSALLSWGKPKGLNHM